MHRNSVLAEVKQGLVKSQSGNCDGLVNTKHITNRIDLVHVHLFTQ